MKKFWAILLIVLGVIFLGENFNFWGGIDWSLLSLFWPILLVLFGFYFLVKQWKEGWWLMVLAVVAAGIFVYIAAYGDNPLLKREGVTKRQKAEQRVYEIEATLEPSAQKIQAEINTGAIEFKIKNSTEKLIDGSLNSSFLEPDLKTSVEGEVAKLTLDTVSFRRRFFFHDFRNELNLALNNSLPLLLSVNSGASDLNFDLSGLKIESFNLKSGASDVDIRLGDAIENNANISLEVGASDIEIEVPKNIGVKIVSESGLTEESFQGFTERDGAYWSESYEGAAKKINIILRAGVSSVRIIQY
jgi:hypothetical protein